MQSLAPAPSEGGKGERWCGHTLCLCSVAGGYEVFGNNWKRKKNEARCSPERGGREDNAQLTCMLVHIYFLKWLLESLLPSSLKRSKFPSNKREYRGLVSI